MLNNNVKLLPILLHYYYLLSTFNPFYRSHINRTHRNYTGLYSNIQSGFETVAEMNGIIAEFSISVIIRKTETPT